VQNPTKSDIAVRAELRLQRDDFLCELLVEIAAQGVTALFGKSGSGKTTCLRLLAGLERGVGALHAFGECWQDDARGVFVPTERRRIGYVFQEASLFSHLDVRDNLRYASKRRAPAASAPDEAAIVAMLDLQQQMGRSPQSLSGGERQRVAIARALLSAPRLLLMDEPLAGLDEARKNEVLPYLSRLREELSIPIVYVSHSIDEVARLADCLVLIADGHVTRTGATIDLMADLVSPLSHADRAGVVIKARIVEHHSDHHLTRLEFAGGFLWVTRVSKALGASVRARVLARDVSIALSEPGPSSILNVIATRVVELSEDGPDRVNVRLMAGSTAFIARITRRSREALRLVPGMEVYAQVKSVALVT
jgi:molybdate transport system ATP-binding protein